MDLPNKNSTPLPQEPQKKVIKQVVPSGMAHGAKRPASRRFMSFLMSESPRDLAGRIGRDILVPRAKAGLEEAANSFLSGMLWGGGGNRPTSNIVQGAVLRGTGGGGMNYAAISAPGQPVVAVTAPGTGPYKDVVVPSQQFAEAVLANAYDLMNQYRVIAVGDLYESAGISPEPHHNSYGWYSLDGARIVKDREGYRIELPRPVKL